ncbi:MAG: hypothetical protein ACRDSZ_11565 [Pseudonocardiaceae bacterium]
MSTPTPTDQPTWMPGIGRRQWLTYVVLCLMALADAYAFWATLDVLLGKDKEFLLVLVIALSLGSVYGAHEIGRMARAQRVNPAEYPALLVIGLSVVLLALSGIMFWIRAHQSDSLPSGRGSLQLSSLSASDSSSLTFALLFLGLYLLTGVLAAGHAYRFGDPRSADLLEAIRQRRKHNHELVKRTYELRLVEGLLKQKEDEQNQEPRVRDGKYEGIGEWGNALRADKDEAIIEKLGDPAATDAITRRNNTG